MNFAQGCTSLFDFVFRAAYVIESSQAGNDLVQGCAKSTLTNPATNLQRQRIDLQHTGIVKWRVGVLNRRVGVVNWRFDLLS